MGKRQCAASNQREERCATIFPEQVLSGAAPRGFYPRMLTTAATRWISGDRRPEIGGPEGTSQAQMTIQTRTRVPSAAANGKNGHTLISDEKFRQLYTLALRLRMTAEQENGSGMRSFAGREAVLSGVAADLRADDVVVAPGELRVADLMRGRGQWAASKESSGGLQRRVIDAMSSAAADRLRKNGRVTVILLDGADMAPLLAEAHAMASGGRLPVLFVDDAQEDGAAANGSNGSERFQGEMPAIPVDAHDVVALYRVAHESITRARAGGGPTRIRCLALQAARGRKVTALGEQDAVKNLESWLTARGLPAQQWRQQIVAGFGPNSAGQRRPE